MENNEIDLRQYWVAVVRRWRLILGVALLVAVTAGLLTAMRTPSYRATVAIETAYPRYVWRFDTSIQGVVDTRVDPRDALLPLARTQAMFASLSKALGGTPTPGQLSSMCSTRRGDGVLVYLDVQAADPQQAANIANEWGRLLIDTADPTRAGLALLEAEWQIAEDEVRQAATALEAFVAHTGRLDLGLGVATAGEDGPLFAGMSASQQRLLLKSSMLAAHQQALDNLQIFVTIAEQATDIASLPVQLLSTSVLIDRGRATPQALAQLGDLDQVLALLNEEIGAVTQVTEALQADVFQSQQQLAQEDTEFGRLTRERLLVLERANHLARKVDELNTQQQVDDSRPLIVSAAKAPAVSTGVSLPLVILSGLIIGLFAGIVIALAWEFIHRWLSETR